MESRNTAPKQAPGFQSECVAAGPYRQIIRPGDVQFNIERVESCRGMDAFPFFKWNYTFRAPTSKLVMGVNANEKLHGQTSLPMAPVINNQPFKQAIPIANCYIPALDCGGAESRNADGEGISDCSCSR